MLLIDELPPHKHTDAPCPPSVSARRWPDGRAHPGPARVSRPRTDDADPSPRSRPLSPRARCSPRPRPLSVPGPARQGRAGGRRPGGPGLPPPPQRRALRGPPACRPASARSTHARTDARTHTAPRPPRARTKKQTSPRLPAPLAPPGPKPLGLVLSPAALSGLGWAGGLRQGPFERPAAGGRRVARYVVDAGPRSQRPRGFAAALWPRRDRRAEAAR